jgi:hypothetical protein
MPVVRNPTTNLWQTSDTVMGGTLAAELRRLHDEGRSPRSIAAWLGERGVFVSHPTVASWLAHLNTEAAA